MTDNVVYGYLVKGSFDTMVGLTDAGKALPDGRHEFVLHATLERLRAECEGLRVDAAFWQDGAHKALAGGEEWKTRARAAEAALDELRPLLGMMGWDGTHAEAVKSIIAARDQFFLQACDNGGAAQQEQARAEAAEAELARLKPKPKRMGRCENKRMPGGCPNHNLQCGYPKCDEWPEEPE